MQRKATRAIKLLPILILLALFWTTICYSEDWPQWRGPNGDGISVEADWSSTWPEDGPKKLWQKSIGVGYSSVTVSNGRLYTMGNAKKTDTVYCLNAETGENIWKYSYECKQGSWKGPRIAPTIDGNRAYTLSREGHLFCFDATSGEIIWSKNLRKDIAARLPKHGFSCHPFIVDNMMILETGSQNGSIVAFDKANGNIIWQSGKAKAGYSTPSLYIMDGKKYLAFLTGMNLVGMDLVNGTILWRHKWETEYQCSIATPIISNDKIFISSGYGMGCALLQIRANNAPKLLWKNQNMANHFNTSVLWNGYLYGFHGAPKHNKDKGELRCIDFETGDVIWQYKDLGKGSLMMADEKLVILGEKGKLAIAEPSPDGYKEIASAKVLDGTCWTVPVLSNGRIYCRNYEGELVCVDVSKSVVD